MMQSNSAVPFVDLVSPHLALEEEILDAVRNIVRSASFIGGPSVKQFEEEFASFCEAEHCIGVSSGTDALRFALIAAGVGSGDIVITVPNTFIATVEAISQAGAVPKFVDIDPETFNINVAALRSFLENECETALPSGAFMHRSTGRQVKAIVPVHLYGQMCDMDPIVELADATGLVVVEDACQAHGAQYYSARKERWLTAGSIGKAAAFSFYPGKNLGAAGEAGAVTTNDEEVAERIRMIRDHGQSRKYHHVIEGYNGRLDALQAAILRLKLPRLKEWNDARRKSAAAYSDLLMDVPAIRTPMEPDWTRSVYHLYVVRTDERDGLQRHLAEKNIGTGLHYPEPLHLQPAYDHLGYDEGDLPVTEEVSRDIISLPMFPQLRKDQLEQVVEEARQFSRSHTAGQATRSY